MFGGGTVAVVVDPAPLLRSKADREALERAIRTVAPGNALVFLEQGDARAEAIRGAPGPRGGGAQGGRRRQGVQGAQGGRARRLDRRTAPRSARSRSGRDAAKELARRVGGFVSEGDVDRQRQGALAVGELEKLALYRPVDPVTEDDVRALVAEVVPDSTWAFLDAVAERRADRRRSPRSTACSRRRPSRSSSSSSIAGSARCSIAADLRRRGRDRRAARARRSAVQPFRAQKLVGAGARAGRLDELDAALEGVLDLDAMVKGAPDASATDAQRRLAFSLWIRDRVAPPAPSPVGAAAR